MRAALIEYARADDDVVGAALVGSAARASEDEWSDIDLVLQLAPDAEEPGVVADWTAFLEREGGVSDTLDLFAGDVRYRVFLLHSSLQVDVSFWPQEQFRGTGEAFRLLFGTANEPTQPRPIDVAHTIGMAWLQAIHARSAVARGRVWQAGMMLDELRQSLVTLLCARAGLNPWHGREADRLPPGVLAALAASRASDLSPASLERSRLLLTGQLLAEIAHHDQDRFDRLRVPFEELGRSVL